MNGLPSHGDVVMPEELLLIKEPLEYVVAIIPQPTHH